TQQHMPAAHERVGAVLVQRQRPPVASVPKLPDQLRGGKHLRVAQPAGEHFGTDALAVDKERQVDLSFWKRTGIGKILRIIEAEQQRLALRAVVFEWLERRSRLLVLGRP